MGPSTVFSWFFFPDSFEPSGFFFLSELFFPTGSASDKLGLETGRSEVGFGAALGFAAQGGCPISPRRKRLIPIKYSHCIFYSVRISPNFQVREDTFSNARVVKLGDDKVLTVKFSKKIPF